MACAASELGFPMNMNTQHPTNESPLSSQCPGVTRWRRFVILLLIPIFSVSGCSIFPDVKTKPQYHNPFPELTVLAVLPFRNQSQEPSLSGMRVSLAYYNELQTIPGFEVLPVGVVETQLAYFEMHVIKRPISTTEDFQNFARMIGADAVLQGAITDYHAYYPPRMTLKVNWYAANPGFHPIPVGYGLPWGTKEEKNIPNWVKLEAERELARAQIATQTPLMEEVGSGIAPPKASPRSPHSEHAPNNSSESELPSPVKQNDAPELVPADLIDEKTANSASIDSKIASSRILLRRAKSETVKTASYSEGPIVIEVGASSGMEVEEPTPAPTEIATAGAFESETFGMFGEELPANWPDPNGFIPPRPQAKRPTLRPQYDAVISHMKAYNGNDEDFTRALEDYYYFRDDARTGGWQTYLQRSEDFIRFCCHLHVVETLGSRGGQLKSRLNVRWPIYRYVR